PADYILVCGTYTDNGSHGIYSVRFSGSDGSLSVIDSVQAKNPSYVAIAPDGRHVYAVGECGGESCVYSVDYDASTGIFGSIVRLDSVGADPCYIALAGNHIVTADYSGGSVSVFDLDADGKIARLSRCDQFSGCGADSLRQASPHIHCTMPSPDNKMMLVSDLGTDRLYRYAIGTEGIALTDTMQLAPGFGPRHIAFSADGKMCYVIGELSGDIAVIDVDSLTVKQTVTCDTLHVRGSGDIHLSHDRRFLYASNRLEGDGIRAFAVDADGLLTDVQYQPTGKHPRNFFITPCDRYLLVAARDDNSITVYSRDIATGRLTATGKSLQLPHPVCITTIR
ncbi:MAG: lactonase family protein, partial [Muribaculaceae bacterium]